MGFFFAFIAIAMLLGCKKETTETSSLIASEKPIQKIKAWYNAAPSESKTQTVEVNGNKIKIAAIPFWEEAKYYVERNIIIAPIKIGAGHNDAATFKYLIAKYDGNGDIIEVNYYKVAPQKIILPPKYLTIDNIELATRVVSDNSRVSDFTGSIVKYNSNNKLLATSTYQKGILINMERDEQNTPGEVVLNVAPTVCSSYIVDSWWVTYLNGVAIEVEHLYSTTYSTCPGEGGGSGGGNSPVTDSIVGYVTDNYLAICPDNFDFTSSGTGNLWQGAGISSVHSDLSFTDFRTNTSFLKGITMPTLYVEMQYKNQSGTVVITPAQAKAKAAEAINRGNLEAREYFKTHPYAPILDLQTVWLNASNSKLAALTNGLGTVSGSVNHSYPTVIVNTYLSGCPAY